MDNIDFDTAFRDAMEGIAPAKWQKKREDVQASREQQAEEANAAKMETMAMEAGQAALKARPEDLRGVGDALGGVMDPAMGPV